MLKYSYAIITVSFCLFLIFSLSCSSSQQKTDRNHHTENGFRNSNDLTDHGFFDFLKWRWERLWKDIPSPESYNFPLADNDPEFLRNNHTKTTLTWIGHATVLFQTDGLNVLTDPIFSERASPVQWAGPKRVVPPGIVLKDLPEIDIVIISHDHYDSLNKPTIRDLYERKGGRETQFFVPLGLKAWFNRLGILNVKEMDWWDEHIQENIRIIAAPMQHWGKRSPFSRNEHLWASWVVLSDDFRFYFGGDTGYSPHFQKIGERFGPFDLSAIPIGAYEPRWFMRNHHINPEEAVKAHLDLRSEKSVAIHWGTFILTDEPLDEPPKLLEKALSEHNLSGDDFLVLKHGETIVLD